MKKLWVPSQDTYTSLHTTDLLWTLLGFTDMLGLTHGPQNKKLSILHRHLNVLRWIIVELSEWEVGGGKKAKPADPCRPTDPKQRPGVAERETLDQGLSNA